MDRFIYIFKKRIDLKDSNRLIIQTGSCARYMKDVRAVSYVNGVESKVTVIENPDTSLLFVYKNAEPEFDTEYNFCIDLSEKVNSVRVVFDKRSYPSGHEEITLNKAQIAFLRRTMEISLAGIRLEDGRIKVTGWAECGGAAEYEVFCGGKKVICDITRFIRKDIAARFPKGEIEEKCAFELSIPDTTKRKLKINALCGGRKGTVTVGIAHAISRNNGSVHTDTAAAVNGQGAGTGNDAARKSGDDNGAREPKKDSVRFEFANRSSYISRAIRYIAAYGMKRFMKKLWQKIRRIPSDRSDKYFKLTNPDAERLKEQREYVFPVSLLFSVLIPVYRPDIHFFTSMLDSIVSQTYGNWQICLADGGGDGHTVEAAVMPYIEKYGKDKIRYVKLENNLGIAENTNEAMKFADGDYIVFGDHDDELHRTALFECMRVIEQYPDVDFIYSDEDKLIEDTGIHSQAYFKSDLNMELLRRNNYICHLVTVKRTLADKVGPLDGKYNGAQDYDYVLRCIEQADMIIHIPRILYHWRINDNSTAKSTSTKNYANEAGKNAVAMHLKRMEIAGEVIDGIVPCMYAVRYTLPSRPLVSVIIPNKDNIGDLRRCISSIENISTYKNLEYIIVENNSTDKDTFDGYKELENTYSGRLRVVYWEGEFNYSAINNFGVRYANGDYFLLLNNDTSLIEPASIELMMSHCMRAEVGIAGAKLLYADNTVQHGGIALGYQGVAGHSFVGLPDEAYGYFGRARTAQEVSAVTAACLLTKKSVYEQTGGFDESFKVAFNDMDYCLKVRKAGYKIIYEPDAKWHHYESKTRGLDDTPAKQERFYGEVMHFIDKWRAVLKEGDPYYNPNLDLIGTLYDIKE